MGPVNSNSFPGRGDKTIAISQVVSQFTEKQSLDILKEKLKRLTKEDQDKLQEILLGEDLDDLLETSESLE